MTILVMLLLITAVIVIGALLLIAVMRGLVWIGEHTFEASAIGMALGGLISLWKYLH